VAFLLEEMFSGSLEWPLGDKRAVDLARTPGGLSVILEYRRKQTQALFRQKSKSPRTQVRTTL